MLGFRVWYKNSMIYDSTKLDDEYTYFASIYGQLHYFMNNDEVRPLCVDEDDTIAMQSTGLCDNYAGKLIFEGDIVEVGYLSNSFVSDECILEGVISTIEVKQVTGFLLKLMGMIPARNRPCLKVLGNVYQDPELLEKLE